jgi:hypothetical protein
LVFRSNFRFKSNLDTLVGLTHCEIKTHYCIEREEKVRDDDEEGLCDLGGEG